MQNLVQTLAAKYDVKAIQERLLELENTPSIRIGFVGEFSAGKSSLINSILGIHLPTNINPTTKAICLVEPTEGTEDNVYFKEMNGTRQQVEFDEFRNILRGEKDESVAVVQVRPSKVLPSGCVFVDTPGIHTAVGDEAELTYAYLAMMDAAIICINVTEGIIGKSLLDFICSPQLKHMQKHFVFAITWGDRKSPEECEIVKKAIVDLLDKTIAEGRLEMDNAARRVFVVSAKDEGNAEKVYNVLQDVVLGDLPALCEQRKGFTLRAIAGDLAEMLESTLKMSSYDSAAVDEQKVTIRKDIQSLKKLCQEREAKLNDLCCSMTEKVRSVLATGLSSVASAESPETRAEILNAVNDQLTSMLENDARTYLGISASAATGLGTLGTDIESKLQMIDTIKNLSVTIGTSIATAFIAPGAGVAANAAEAAAGAAASKAAKVAQVAGKVAKAGTFAKVLGGLGTVLREINPLEHIGSACAMYAKKNAIENLALEKSSAIAQIFISSLEQPYQNEVLQPLMDKLEYQRQQLEMLSDKENEDFKKFQDYCSGLKSDIVKLRSALEI